MYYLVISHLHHKIFSINITVSKSIYAFKSLLT
uniref:Uncharacterized protein n=1 Tax=Anguilla anguilla TaxID=7936 RepID=A0A0E9UAK2_ANGAN